MNPTTGNTYTSPFGGTTQGTQLDQAVQTLQNMGQIQNPIQGFQQTNQATNQAIAAYPQYANQQAQGLYNASNLDPLIQQHGLDLNTFTQMLANDPLGQRYLNPAIASQGPTTQTIGGQAIPGVVSALPQQTLANVNTPYAGLDNPLLAMSAGNLQAGADVTSLNMLGQTIGENLSKMESQLTQNLGGYNTQIQLLQNLADRYMQQAQYNLQLQQLGLMYSPLTGGASGLQPVASLQQQGLSRRQIQQTYQQAWQNSVLTSQQNQIAQAYKNATGYDLFPGKLSTQDETTARATYSLLQKVSRIKQYLQAHPNAAVGPWGAMQQSLVNMNLGSWMNPDERQYLADLTSITTGGERQAIAGRLTGYLLDRLKSAFPGVGNSVQQNLELLNNIQSQAYSDLQTIADNASYASFIDLPGAQAIQPIIIQQLKQANPNATNQQIQDYLDQLGQ